MVRTKLLRTSDHGVPQKRRRLFLVAIRADSIRADANLEMMWPEPIPHQALAIFHVRAVDTYMVVLFPCAVRQGSSTLSTRSLFRDSLSLKKARCKAPRFMRTWTTSLPKSEQASQQSNMKLDQNWHHSSQT